MVGSISPTTEASDLSRKFFAQKSTYGLKQIPAQHNLQMHPPFGKFLQPFDFNP
jgi:hypothetical protein